MTKSQITQIQSPELLAHIRNISFFSLLDNSTQQELINDLEQISLTKDEYLFHQGDPGDDGIYAVIEGQLRVFFTQSNDDTPLIVDEHGPGGVVGEIGTLIGSPRTATIQAITPSRLIRISKAIFDDIKTKNPKVISEAMQLALQRLQRPQLFSVLPHLFGPLDLDTFAEVEAELTWLHLARGEQLIRQGETDANLYVLISGRLQVAAEDQDRQEQMIGEIVPGESVGEMQLLTGEPRSASVYAIRDSELVMLSKAGFDRLVEKYPQIMKQIAQQVIQRLQQKIQPTITNKLDLALDIVIVPISPSVSLPQFSQRLANALEVYGETLILDEIRFDTEVGRPGAAQISEGDPTDMGLVIWLNQQAKQYKLRLFQTNPNIDPWTKRCLRQADLVLLVGWAKDQPDLSTIEMMLRDKDDEWRGVRKHLVLLHKDNQSHPVGTAAWLNNREIQQHHHLRQSRTADYERLARFITGRAVGLVFGGGGVRGLAQLGVIRAIEELGLEIDLVGGSSFGAIIAGYYAMEWDYDTIYRSVKQRADRKLVLDFTFPFTAFSKGQKAKQRLKEIFGDIQIEDTWRTYFCTSSNLSTAEEMVHYQGPIWKYIRASGALPPLFPPVIDNGMVLMDGGIFNNIPLDVMRGLTNGGPVIGVDVTVDEEQQMDEYEFGTILSGWRILWSYLNPFTPRIKAPSLHSIVIRLTTLSNIKRRLEQMHLADLCMYPPVAQFGPLEAEAIDDIIEVGYQTGQQELTGWMADRSKDQSEAES